MTRSRRWYLLTGALLVGAVLFVALFAEQLTPVSPHYWDARTSILQGRPPFPPEPGHLLGTDEWGRDVWTRLALGARWSLFFALLITAGRLAVALPAAFAAAYGHRRITWAIDKLYVVSSAIPPLLIYLLLLSPPQLRLIGLWPNVVLTVTVLTVMEWPRLAVTLKGRLEQLLTEPFVEGAVASGGSSRHIFAYHLLPHLWPTLLHLMAAEMARALLVIAQMGVFGIMVGGGVLNVIDNGRGGEKWIITTGVPEWGNLLADGRPFVLTRPWIPFAPAFAFLIAVVGFNLLSQGLEGVTISLGRLKAATTGRLDFRWRWLWLALPVAAVLLYCQGLPWTRAEGIKHLAMYQAERLNAGDTGAYLSTIAPSAATTLADYRRWAGSLDERDIESVSIYPDKVAIRGSRATAIWEMTIGYRSKPPETVRREVELVRRLGRWYEQGEPFDPLRGYHADVDAIYDPIDPAHTAVPLRWNVQFLATSLDHAYESLQRILGWSGGTRPLVRLYPSHHAFLDALGPGIDSETTAHFTAGEPLRLSPLFLKGYKRWDIEKNLAYELIKYLAATGNESGFLDPVVMGRYELVAEEAPMYAIDFYRMTGAPLMTLPDLFAVRADQLDQERQWVYVAEAAVLVQFLEEHLPGADLTATPWTQSAMAKRLGLSEAELTARYDRYLYERMADESILTVPAARGRVPETLLNAVADRSDAAVARDLSRFLDPVESSSRKGQQQWLEAADKAGLQQYETTILDYDASTDQVYVLERLTLAGGKVMAGVTLQRWREVREGHWTLAAVKTPLLP